MKLTSKTARLIAREVASEMALSIQKRLEALTQSTTAEKAIRRTAIRMAEALHRYLRPDKTPGARTASRRSPPMKDGLSEPTTELRSAQAGSR